MFFSVTLKFTFCGIQLPILFDNFKSNQNTKTIYAMKISLQKLGLREKQMSLKMPTADLLLDLLCLPDQW